MSNRRSFQLLVFVWMLISSFNVSVHASIIAGGFTGHITSINDPDGWFDGLVELNQLVTGVVVYDDVPSNSFTAGPGTTYLFFGLGQNIYVDVGNESYKADLGLNVKIYNNDPVFDDRYGYISTSDAGFPFEIEAPFLGAISIHLDDPSGTALINEDFVPILPSIDDYPVRVGNLRILELEGSVANPVATVEFSVNTFVPVPDPGTSILLLIALGMAGRNSYRRRA